MEIIPAILTDDVREAEELLRQVAQAAKFGRVQVDFVDGEYNNNRTFLPGDLLVSDFGKLKFDAHLMVVQKNIGRWVSEAEAAGYERIISQVESVSEPERFSGLALDVHSPVAAIEPYLVNLEVVVVMAVEPGYGGKEFVDSAVESVSRLSRIRRDNNYRYRICVDGGVQKEHLGQLEKAGADEVAVGAKRVLEW